jgi:hypothetical protein
MQDDGGMIVTLTTIDPDSLEEEIMTVTISPDMSITSMEFEEMDEGDCGDHVLRRLEPAAMTLQST